MAAQSKGTPKMHVGFHFPNARLKTGGVVVGLERHGDRCSVYFENRVKTRRPHRVVFLIEQEQWAEGRLGRGATEARDAADVDEISQLIYDAYTLALGEVEPNPYWRP